LGNTSNKLGPKIDTRGNGGYVIAPGSVTPAGAYALLTGQMTPENLPSVPAPLLARLAGHAAPDTTQRVLRIDTGRDFANTPSADLAEVQEILSQIPADCGYDDWVAVLMGIHDHFNGSGAGLDVADRWSAQGSKYRPGEVVAKWRGFQTVRGAGWGSVCALARQNGADLGAIARVHRRQGNFPDIKGTPSAFSTKRDGTPPKDKGPARAKWCADIACTILETDPAWAGVLAYDEFAGLYLLLKPIPGTKAPRATFTPRPMADTDTTAAVRWFNRNGYPDATKNGTADALELVAMQAIISPVRHFLESLSWDGRPRVTSTRPANICLRH